VLMSHFFLQTLFPDLNMEEVGRALSRGMDLVKAAMCRALDLIEPSVNHQNLLTPTALEFEWGTEHSFMSVSVYTTAHCRYCEWYHHHFAGTKRRRADSPTDETESARHSTKRAYGNVSSSESVTSESETPSESESRSDTSSSSE